MRNPLTAATTKNVCEFIQSAAHRLVVIAPAVDVATAKEIAAQWERLGADHVIVTLDPDPEVYRLGYGDFDGLALLERAGREVGGLLQCQPGVRISVIIADEQVMVYAPTPRLVQAGPRDANAPNALLLPAPPRDLEAAIGVGEAGVAAQEIGLDKATSVAIEEVRKDLEINPPQQFDVARRVRVFNAAFQFVALEMTGTNIGRRTVEIPNHLMVVSDAKTQRELRTSMRVLPEDHELSGKDLDSQRRELERRYLKVIRGFGYAILRTNKPAFDEAVISLQERVNEFRAEVEKRLSAELKNRVDALEQALVPNLLDNPPKKWSLSKDPRTRVEQIWQFTREDLERAVGAPSDYVKDMSIRVVYRDVAYESLADKSFMAAAREAFPALPALHEEYDASAAQPPRRGL